MNELMIKRDQIEAACPSADIAAYIDGELTPIDDSALESHLSICRVCSDELNLQKQFVIALEGSLKSSPDLPIDFTKRIVTNAESSVRGLRRKNERLSAMFVCSALFFFVVFVLGASAPGSFAAGLDVISRAGAVVSFFGHLIYDFSIAVIVILRTIGGQSSFGPVALLLIVPLTIVLAYRYSLARSTRERIEYSESGSSL
jgi:hypothetical protein